jgi:hypothetical protein
MTDLRTLTDAFTELERRADAVTAGTPFPLPPRRTERSRSRLVPVAATVVTVAGLAAGVALLAPGDDPGPRTGSSPPSTSTSTRPPTSAPPARAAMPSTTEDLADRFRAALGGMATFTVTDGESGAAVITLPPSPGSGPSGRTPAGPPQRTHVGATIIGTLTASGVTGGFYLSSYPLITAERCDVLDPAHCTARRLPDDSTLIIGQEPLEGATGSVSYMAELLRADGVDLILYVSNQRSPKGASQKLAAQPPLTTDQLAAIITSDRL